MMTALPFPSISRSASLLLTLLLLSVASTTTEAFQPILPTPARHPAAAVFRNTIPPEAVAATTDWISSSTSTAPLVSQLESFWQTCPYQAAALVCGVKASAADWVAQSQSMAGEEDEDSALEEPALSWQTTAIADHPHNTNNMWDMKRNAAFLLYGALYQGMAHEFIFNHLYPVWFGTGVEPTVVATKVAFNLLVQTTLVTLPFAYLCKAAVCGSGSNSEDNNNTNNSDPASNHAQQDASTLEDNNNNNNQNAILDMAFSKYWDDIQTQGLLWKCFALWGPVQCLTFSVIPEHLRVTFIAFVSFFWLILLSHISSTEVTTTMAEEEELDVAAAVTPVTSSIR